MDDQSDSALVGRARQGDTCAFELLLARHLPQLRVLCHRALGDAMLADDAVQEAALQAFLSLDRLRQPARFGPWLYSIGLNISRLMLRLRSRDAWSWEALLGGMYVSEPIDPGAQPIDRAELLDLQQRVQQAVAALPPGQRAAVLLFYLGGLSHAETAAMLGIDVGAVKTRLHKARERLRNTLWSLWKEQTMAAGAETNLVEMRVVDVWRMPGDGTPPRLIVVVLEEITGARCFPLFVGPWEGEALALTLEQVETPRPLTYTLAARMLEATGHRLREARINRLADNVFYAQIVVAGPSGTHTLDARASDALNLAVLMGAPIRVPAEVIE